MCVVQRTVVAADACSVWLKVREQVAALQTIPDTAYDVTPYVRIFVVVSHTLILELRCMLWLNDPYGPCAPDICLLGHWCVGDVVILHVTPSVTPGPIDSVLASQS